MTWNSFPNRNTIKTSDVSAVVCAWNAEVTISACLKSLRDNNVGEIILVDASSEDNTMEFARPYVDLILTDPREGLAKARNIGIQNANRKYVLNVGTDNIMPNGSIQKMIDFSEMHGFAGVSAMTYIKDTNMNYFSWAMNCYKKARYYSGEREVIGTPTLFPTTLLRENPYDNKMSWSDDGDLCDRLRLKGHKFAIADVVVYEIGSENLKSVMYRWKGYGKSDWEIYNKYSSQWDFKRKIRSILHPFKNELIFPFLSIPGVYRFLSLPFLIGICLIRYYYWLHYTIKDIIKRKTEDKT